jgi:23S rRNA (adenine2503-C2)-methyltransferase
MNLKKLKKILDDKKQPAFRFKQIMEDVYKNGKIDFNDMTNLPKDLREMLAGKINILSFAVEKILVAKDGMSAKALLKLADSNFIETVLISTHDNNWSVCLSSQIGCPLACSFCATGQAGFKRNLSAEEISDQILFWNNWLRCVNVDSKEKSPLATFAKVGGKITNIVYMGMGEPFLNWENVSQSLSVLTDQNLYGFGGRSISISTIGIPEGIKRLSKDFPQINLAISLHSGNNNKRDNIVPFNKHCNLAELKIAIEKYLEKTKRKVFIEYVMIDKVNDGEDDAKDLATYLKSIRDNYLLLVNIIAYNGISPLAPLAKGGNKFKSASKEKIAKFKNYLLRNSLNTTVRKSLGSDIFGACGQLSGDNLKKLKIK